MRKLYAYGVGADSEDIKSETARLFLDGFVADGYRLPSLLRSIVTSEQFFSAPPPALSKVSLNAATR